jgi:hypothetical protein
MGTATMARPKKATPAPKAQPEPTAGPRPTALTIKGNREWRAWVDRGAEHCRTDVAKVVDAALIEYFKSKGFGDPPPKR